VKSDDLGVVFRAGVGEDRQRPFELLRRLGVAVERKQGFPDVGVVRRRRRVSLPEHGAVDRKGFALLDQRRFPARLAAVQVADAGERLCREWVLVAEGLAANLERAQQMGLRFGKKAALGEHHAERLPACTDRRMIGTDRLLEQHERGLDRCLRSFEVSLVELDQPEVVQGCGSGPGLLGVRDDLLEMRARLPEVACVARDQSEVVVGEHGRRHVDLFGGVVGRDRLLVGQLSLDHFAHALQLAPGLMELSRLAVAFQRDRGLRVELERTSHTRGFEVSATGIDDAQVAAGGQEGGLAFLRLHLHHGRRDDLDAAAWLWPIRGHVVDRGAVGRVRRLGGVGRRTNASRHEPRDHGDGEGGPAHWGRDGTNHRGRESLPTRDGPGLRTRLPPRWVPDCRRKLLWNFPRRLLSPAFMRLRVAWWWLVLIGAGSGLIWFLFSIAAVGYEEGAKSGGALIAIGLADCFDRATALIDALGSHGQHPDPPIWMAIATVTAVVVPALLRLRPTPRARRVLGVVTIAVLTTTGVALLGIRQTLWWNFDPAIVLWMLSVVGLCASPWLRRHDQLTALAAWEARPSKPGGPLGKLENLSPGLRDTAEQTRALRVSLDVLSGLDAETLRLAWDWTNHVEHHLAEDAALLNELGLSAAPIRNALGHEDRTDTEVLLELDKALGAFEKALVGYRSFGFR